MTRLLIIDDEVQLLANIARYLESFPGEHDVEIAATGEDGMALFRLRPPDILLTDVRLPGIDGLEVARRALADRPGLRVVAMTAHSSPKMRSSLRGRGIMRLLEKPVDLEELRQLLLEIGPSGDGWSESTSGLDLFDLMQLVILSGRARSLRVGADGRTGVLILSPGKLEHASTGNLTGVAAFREMMTWNVDRFERIEGAEPVDSRSNIDVSTTQLMIEAARLRDDQRGSQALACTHPESACEVALSVQQRR